MLIMSLLLSASWLEISAPSEFRRHDEFGLFGLALREIAGDAFKMIQKRPALRAWQGDFGGQFLHELQGVEDLARRRA